MEDKVKSSFIVLVSTIAIISIVFMFYLTQGSVHVVFIDMESPTGQIAVDVSGKKVCSSEWEGKANPVDTTMEMEGSPGACVFNGDQNLDPFKAGSVTLTSDGVESTFYDQCDLNIQTDLVEYWCDRAGNLMQTRYSCTLGCFSGGPKNHHCDKGRKVVTCVAAQ